MLAHELGHVKYRHGLRVVAQAGVVGIVASVIVGDFSTLLAGASTLLAQAGYSRDFEREADTNSRELMLGAGIEPRVMVTFFDRLGEEARRNDDVALPIAFFSHPADAERIAFFRR